jgi:hypothetical protein
MSLDDRRRFTPTQRTALYLHWRDRVAPRLGSFIDELGELEARVAGSRVATPDATCSVRRRLELVAWARHQQLELEERDLNFRVRCRTERQHAARGWIAVVAQGVGVAAMAVVAAIGTSAAAGDYRATLGACAVAGAGGAAGLARRYVRRCAGPRQER